MEKHYGNRAGCQFHWSLNHGGYVLTLHTETIFVTIPLSTEEALELVEDMRKEITEK